MKTIAMYLPQFHETEENNMWWGKGYTEWTAVRGARPLFQGHIQPRVPLDKNYYNLLDKETLKKQVELAKKYEIYGFCFYHYWFEDGKQALERPVENFLKWQDIKMPFCFCWANETWIRTWSKMRGANTWTSIYGESSGYNEDILLRQKYGREKEWKKHFDYLLSFFSDERYIKINGKPVIVIYRPENMICISEMVKFWNEEAIKAGLPGVYIIGENFTKSKMVDGFMEHQPITSQNRMSLYMKEISGVRTLDYEQVWNNIIYSEPETEKDVFYMGFTGFDNTPRHGNKGVVYERISPSVFEKYFTMLVQKSKQRGNEYIFLNAWNEWGEGMYLEPDEKNGYAFLESHKRAITAKNSMEIKIKSLMENKVCNLPENKMSRYYKLLNEWMDLKDSKKSLADYLIKNDYMKVAIYGMGDMGKHFLHEVENSQVEVVYAIDKRKIDSSIKVLSDKDEWPQVDAVIVTPFLEFETILKNIGKKIECAVVSIEEIIYEMS